MKLLLFLLVGLWLKASVKEPSLSQVRMLYKKAAYEKEACKQLIELLDFYNERNSPVLAGYKACATMLMASFVNNPFTKLSYFSNGKSMLEKSIQADKKNLELRFLRFTIQCNAPFFLGYNDSFKEDKALLINSLSSINDLEMKQWVQSFLVQYGKLSPMEKLKINYE